MSEDLAAPEVPVAEQPPVAETPAPAPAEPPAEGAPPEPPADDNKGKERLQARFSELTAKARTAEQEAAYWREQALSRAQPEEPEPGPDGAPPEDIGAKIEAEIEARLEARSQKTRMDTVKAKIGDADEGAIIFFSDPALPVSKEMLDVVLNSDNAVKLADHLGKNPAEAARISRLPASVQGYELARLESRLASPARTTNAPGPTPKVEAGAPVSDEFRSGMSQADFEASINRKHGDFYGRR